MVYILPESKFLIEVFPAFHVFAPPVIRSVESVTPEGQSMAQESASNQR
jgi:hypothetical protein